MNGFAESLGAAFALIATGDAALGEIVGPAITYDAVTDAIETIVETYLSNQRDGESFLDTYRRVGKAPFKEALYGAH